jgi:hypothetical protein
MWHFECIEFGPSKPKYLESHIKKGQREAWASRVQFIRFCPRISSWLGTAVNGTKAFKKQFMNAHFDSVLKEISQLTKVFHFA